MVVGAAVVVVVRGRVVVVVRGARGRGRAGHRGRRRRAAPWWSWSAPPSCWWSGAAVVVVVGGRPGPTPAGPPRRTAPRATTSTDAPITPRRAARRCGVDVLTKGGLSVEGRPSVEPADGPSPYCRRRRSGPATRPGPATASALVEPGRSRWCARRWCAGRAAAPSRGQSAAPTPGLLQVARVRAAPLPQLVEGAPEVPVEPPDLGRRQRPRRPGGIEPGPPQQLVGEQVARGRRGGPGPSAGPSAARRSPARMRPSWAAPTDAASGPRRSSSGSSSTPTEAPGIAQAQGAAAVEVDDEALPRRVLAVARRTGARRWRRRRRARARPVMPKRRPRVGPVVARVEQEQLAPSPVGHERPADQRVDDLAAVEPALQEPRVGGVDGDDGTPERGRRRPSVDLDLQHLRHERGSRSARWRRPGRAPGRSRRRGRRGARARPTPARCPGLMPLAASSSGGEVHVGRRRRVGHERLGPAERGGQLGDAAGPRRTCSPASRPPTRSKVSRPPGSAIWRWASSCWGCDSSPG